MMEGEIKRYPHNDDSHEEDKGDDVHDVPHGTEILRHPSPLDLLGLHQDPAQNEGPQDVLLDGDVRFGGRVAEPEDHHEEKTGGGGVDHEAVDWDVDNFYHPRHVRLNQN